MLFLSHYYLSCLIWLPVLGTIATLATGRDEHANIARGIAIAVSLLSCLLCIPLYLGFNNGTAKMQFVENVPWISAYHINYHLGVDGISLPLILLTTFTTLVVVLAGSKAIKSRVAQYMSMFLLMQGMMVGVFAALDSMLFYVFWEGMLIPMYLSIGIWGGKNRSYASMKFFLYTFFGSILMLVAFIYMAGQVHGNDPFDILSFMALGRKLPLDIQNLLFLAFFMAFAVKVPMWPFHTWLPDAHTEAPTGGSVVLAALMLKMGIYGFLRFSMPMTPAACQYFMWPMIILSLIAIVYIGLVAIAQTDMKKLIAYSSIAHMGFATLGCFLVYLILDPSVAGAMTSQVRYEDAYMSLEGAMVQMVAHAFGSGAMFLGVGFLAERTHSHLMKDYGGVAHKMPIFIAFFMLFCMANVGLPGTAGFVGEFMVILSAFKANIWVALIATSTLVLAAAYTLWMVKKVFFGPVAPGVEQMRDIHGVDILVYSLMAVGVFAIGLYPQFLLNMMHASVDHLLRQTVPLPGSIFK